VNECCKKGTNKRKGKKRENTNTVLLLPIHSSSHSGSRTAQRRGSALGLCPVVLDGALDGVLGEHAAVELDGRQAELLGDLGVLDAARVVERHAAHELRQVRRAGDGRAAAKGLEFHVRNRVGGAVHADLQFHHVATCRSANQSRAHVQISFWHGTDIARVRVMVDHFLVVATEYYPTTGRRGDGDAGGSSGSGDGDSSEHCLLLCVDRRLYVVWRNSVSEAEQ